MISEKQADDIRARLSNLKAWLNGRLSYQTGSEPANCRVTNEERSSLEVYEFCTDKPDKYFLYVKESGLATTWTGEELGTITFGRQWRDNFGGVRVSVKVNAINGRKYHGTYYKSSGDYAMIKAMK